MADQSDEILSRLRGISSDEKSEMGKMKCRIDDQARLIMMLKKRNDEYILANMALDKHSIELENQIDALREELEQQQNSKEKINELTQTIEQLKSSNFQWELKDQQTNQKFSFHNQQYEKLQQNILSFQQEIQRLEQLLE
jgi:thiamine pyrophosphokinase